MDEAPKSREALLAAIKAKADAIRAQRAAAAKGDLRPGAAAPEAAFETPVSAVNAAGRPAGKPQNTTITAYGSVTQGVEFRGERTEDENLKKLLGGLGAYPNPLRGGAWQVDYRYYAEARRRLEQAGYEIDEHDFVDRPLREWSPQTRGWTKTAS
ncbi:MAG TPA: hypothetical protein VGR24_11825 [bacterium]|nr:hypothetical protein [bacterium]